MEYTQNSRFVLSYMSAKNGLRRGSAADRLLELRVRIPRGWCGGCVSVSCKCCVLSGRGLCDELITRPEGSY
jgi:hypothetical protein